MTVKFYNLSKHEMQDLRELEDQYPDTCMLVITKKAFDGQELAKVIVETIEILVPLIDLILHWIEFRKHQKRKDESKAAEIADFVLEVTRPYGEKIVLKAGEISNEALKAIFTLTNQADEG